MFATAQSLRVTSLANAPKKSVERKNVRTMRRVRAQAKKDDVESSDSVISRRALGVSSVALGAALTQNLSFATPAEAKKIVSGYTDLEGIDVSTRARFLGSPAIGRSHDFRVNRGFFRQLCNP